MSGKTWVIADTHFSHQGMCQFTNYDGTKVRPWDNYEEMDEALIENWNSVVSPDDRVYLLGDVAMGRKGLRCVERLQGRIVLVKGNHDQEKLGKYVDLFDDIRACVVKKGFIMTHIPIHPACLARWNLNIHGHLHNNTIKEIKHDNIEDQRYFCASVERINFTPILLDDILKQRKVNQG